MPAIKGDMYINTHCNYSQPTLIKLDNENIGGHLTPLHRVWLRSLYNLDYKSWSQKTRVPGLHIGENRTILGSLVLTHY